MSKKTKEKEQIEVVGEALSKTEQFVEKNKKNISTAIISLILIVALFYFYKSFYVAPLEKEANQQMFMAEKYFELDSFNLALNGNTQYLGFLDIIDDYKRTKSANLANYYAGLCYYYLGDYELAINYVSNFSTSNPILKPISTGVLGDAYMEIGNIKKATKLYLKAAYNNQNNFSTPIYLLKLAIAYESEKDYEKALKYYTEIKKNYKSSKEAKDIDKLIARAKASM